MHAHSCNQCRAFLHSEAMHQTEQRADLSPFSKGASNPAVLTRLPSVSGITEALSPVIYHNDDTHKSGPEIPASHNKERDLIMDF